MDTTTVNGKYGGRGSTISITTTGRTGMRAQALLCFCQCMLPKLPNQVVPGKMRDADCGEVSGGGGGQNYWETCKMRSMG